jgi:hypothetical protein
MKTITYRLNDHALAPKTTPQIVELLDGFGVKFGKEEFNMDDVDREITITTKQPVSRIFAYYAKSMIEGGYITKTVHDNGSMAAVRVCKRDRIIALAKLIKTASNGAARNEYADLIIEIASIKA